MAQWQGPGPLRRVVPSLTSWYGQLLPPHPRLLGPNREGLSHHLARPPHFMMRRVEPRGREHHSGPHKELMMELQWEILAQGFALEPSPGDCGPTTQPRKCAFLTCDSGENEKPCPLGTFLPCLVRSSCITLVKRQTDWSVCFSPVFSGTDLPLASGGTHSFLSFFKTKGGATL